VTRQFPPEKQSNLPIAEAVSTPAEDPRAPRSEPEPKPNTGWWGRLVPLVLLFAVAGLVVATGLYEELSLDALWSHRAALARFVATHGIAAIAAFVAVYVGAVALSIPGAVYLTMAGGFLFGPIAGGLASIVGATIGATVLFLIARTAFGEHLIRRAGPRAQRLAAGFRKDAFSYLLLLRLVPAFPFFLVNLVPALLGVRLAPFVAATALGIIPATFAFAFLGSGLDSVIESHEAAYQACVAAGRADCRMEFELKTAFTPQMIAALVALAVVALIPLIVRRVQARRSAGRAS
jgi:uncharacterized membrane protein YdjX (TVP38/TMEM64 family)